MMSLARSIAGFLLLASFAGCSYAEPKRELAEPSARQFEVEVYPVLLRDCGFAACHGSSERFFQVYGPGRERLEEDADVLSVATPAELDLTFGRARSMLASRDVLKKPLLLRKPLAEAAGGASHGGEDPWKQNVYASTQDRGYQVLASWARSMAAAPEEPAP